MCLTTAVSGHSLSPHLALLLSYVAAAAALAEENALAATLQVAAAYDELMLAHKKEVHCNIITAEVGSKTEMMHHTVNGCSVDYGVAKAASRIGRKCHGQACQRRKG
jgi:hypothetical protein